MSDIKMGDKLLTYIQTEVSGEYCGLDIQDAIILEHSWLKQRVEYLDKNLSELEESQSKINMHEEFERRVKHKVNSLINTQNYETVEQFTNALNNLHAFVNSDIEALQEAEKLQGTKDVL